MLPLNVKTRLMDNWGERADAMECYCEVCFIDDLSEWKCYIFALNPEDEDTIQCIVYHKNLVQIAEWTLTDLHKHYNVEGEYPIIDEEFRPQKAGELFRRITFHG